MMESVFPALIEQLNLAVLVLIAILFGIGWLLYKVGEWIGNYKSKKDDLHLLKQSFDENIPLMKAKLDILYQCAIDSTVRND